MKALSIRQPWAWLIVNGYKTIENRTWRTSYRGPLLIHAGKTIDREGIDALREQWQSDGDPLTEAEARELETTGAIIGVVDLVDCTLTPQGDDCNWHNPGCWAWVLRNPREFDPPLPATGKLGLFDIDIEL